MPAITTTLHRHERGQLVVIFAVALVTVVVMVGLVLDGGSAFAQRRSQQNAADLAALAGANAYLLTNDETAARNAALTTSADNGWEDGTGSTVVDVNIDTTNGAEVTVDVHADHHNNFGSVIGLSTWGVGTTATALAGFPDTAVGAAPVIFSIHAFQQGVGPLPQYSNPNAPWGFGETNGDVPTGAGDIAWTNYGTGNVNTNEVRQIIEGDLVINKTLSFGEYIGQHNQGNHTALFDDVQDNLAGQDVPVPVVDDNGNFMGWATFHITSAEGGSTKKMFGYFKSPMVNQRLTVGGCSANACPSYLGSYVLKLVN
jgi:Flp pilus assembly protein TadG